MVSPTPSSPASSSSSYIPTTTLLAVPDGPIPSSSKDLKSHTVSFVGGYPTFPSLPPSSLSTSVPPSINCGICHSPLPLLTQIYCPPEGGENDRTVYVFGCWRSSCGRRDGSVRAFRASVRNETYVRDVTEKRARKEREEEEAREREAAAAKINPFSAAKTAPIAPGGLGSSLFGGPSPAAGFNPFAIAAPTTASEPPTTAFSSLSVGATTPAPSTAAAGPSTPATTYAPPIPAYQPAQYLDTFEEYLPKKVEPKEGEGEDDFPGGDDEDDIEGKKGAGGGGAAEKWEKVLPRGVDEVFERFMNRLGEAEGGEEQVLRYDLGSHPLPYSSHSDLYKKLFPKGPRPGQHQAITRANHQVGSGANDDIDSDDDEDSELHKKFHPDGVVPPCGRCGGKRVFEMQLVPGLISSLAPESLTTTGKKPSKRKAKESQNQEERRKELAALLAGGEGANGQVDDETMQASGGMEWGTVMVFGCEKDCVGFGEEWVGVEWEQVIDA